MIEAKPLFKERISKIFNNKKDEEEFWEINRKELPNYIRVNTLKISETELVKRLEKKGWKIKRVYENILQIESRLGPGELGKSKEHLLGYYYVQELSSMMPVLALNPCEEDIVIDLCASPGSKTTQIAAKMKNSGVLFANDNRLDRIIILNTNLERCGVSNCIVMMEDAINLPEKLNRKTDRFYFGKILVDAPCSGEGTIRSSDKLLRMWNFHMINKFVGMQKKILSSAVSLLKENGELTYSTCTYAPEENEEILQFALDNLPVEIIKSELPIKTRKPLKEWNGKKFSEQIQNAHRIFPQDNDSEGFFVAKLRKIGREEI
jgi:NOL1/NOP2/sun family putative RNA methylase